MIIRKTIQVKLISFYNVKSRRIVRILFAINIAPVNTTPQIADFCMEVGWKSLVSLKVKRW